MRLLLCFLLAVAVVSCVPAGEKKKDTVKGKEATGDKARNETPQPPAPPKPDASGRGDGNGDRDGDNGRDRDRDRNHGRDKDDGRDGPGDKARKNKGKGEGNGGASIDGRRIPPGIAKQGDAKVDKWLSSRGQLKKDLDDVYDKDPRKRPDKEARQSRAEALYDALADLGMDPDEARRLLRGMASSKDKDDAYDAVRKAMGDATVAGMPGDEVVKHVGNIVDAADSAAAIGDALGKWMKKR